MIVHETAIQQTTVKSKLLRVLLRFSNNEPYHNEAVKSPEIQIVKFIKHDNRPNLLKEC